MVLRYKLNPGRWTNIARARARYWVPRTQVMHACYWVPSRTNFRTKWWVGLMLLMHVESVWDPVRGVIPRRKILMKTGEDKGLTSCQVGGLLPYFHWCLWLSNFTQALSLDTESRKPLPMSKLDFRFSHLWFDLATVSILVLPSMLYPDFMTISLLGPWGRESICLIFESWTCTLWQTS